MMACAQTKMMATNILTLIAPQLLPTEMVFGALSHPSERGIPTTQGAGARAVVQDRAGALRGTPLSPNSEGPTVCYRGVARFSLWKLSIPIYNASLFPELFNAP